MLACCAALYVQVFMKLQLTHVCWKMVHLEYRLVLENVCKYMKCGFDCLTVENGILLLPNL